MKNLRLAIVLPLLAIALTACAPIPRGTVPISTLASSAGDVDVLMGSLEQLATQWNANQLEWVAEYSDPEASWSGFLATQDRVYRAQVSLLSKTSLALSELSGELGNAGYAVLDHYGHRLELLEVIFAAVVQGDDETFHTVGEDYQALTSPTTVIPLLERLFSTPELEALLRAEGYSTTDLIDSLAIGVGADL